ncbi:MAG: pyridoxal-phosphate dependent enzyme [Planctomycetota bacterium]
MTAFDPLANGATTDVDPSMPMLDGATPALGGLPNSLAEQQRIAADGTQSMDERLEAYEDICDSEVGDTALSRTRNVERELGIRQLFLKFEGGNPTGTQKDRIAFAQAMDALRRGFDAITVATCGNYGAAIATAASYAGLRCLIFIPDGYRTRRIAEMSRPGVEIIRVAGDYETAVQASQERADADEIYDANPGGANTALQLSAYGAIAYEIYDELRDAPAAVAVPVSNGTTLAGVHKGFVSLYRRGKTSRIPRMIAGSTFGKNPIINAVLKNLAQCDDLMPERLRETAVNEPLINWHAIDGDLALNAIRESGGTASYASDKNMLHFSKSLREREGLSVLPASTAGLIAFLDCHRREPFSNDRYVVLITGKRA